MMETIFNLLRKFYFTLYIFFKNKTALLKRRWELRKDIKAIEEMGGKVTIKNNEYVGGVTVEVELPVEKESVKKK